MRILVELPTWLGDTVMTTPAIENLVNFHNDSEVVLIGSSASIEIFKNHPHVSKIYVLDKRYLSLFNLARRLGKFDKFFSFRNSIRSFFFQLFISSRDKFKFNRRDFQHCHQVEKYNNFINDALNQDFKVGKLVIRTDLNLNQ